MSGSTSIVDAGTGDAASGVAASRAVAFSDAALGDILRGSVTPNQATSTGASNDVVLGLALHPVPTGIRRVNKEPVHDLEVEESQASEVMVGLIHGIDCPEQEEERGVHYEERVSRVGREVVCREQRVAFQLPVCLPWELEAREGKSG
ncbi:hypothetical protein QAD02_014565 [Eretmocerus hayati]|uniref:Uncharacterized protein n=1 Tax=Eretmocerus hayati TaxID=131215 RepID=A0ACC2P6P8_9HYME|nr:hypothetical protein QAD02_014565 [Eretmocerus hayati]